MPFSISFLYPIILITTFFIRGGIALITQLNNIASA
jgi:hypothetical protein